MLFYINIQLYNHKEIALRKNDAVHSYFEHSRTGTVVKRKTKKNKRMRGRGMVKKWNVLFECPLSILNADE